jgi:hypothetical protein
MWKFCAVWFQMCHVAEWYSFVKLGCISDGSEVRTVTILRGSFEVVF